MNKSVEESPQSVGRGRCSPPTHTLFLSWEAPSSIRRKRLLGNHPDDLALQAPLHTHDAVGGFPAPTVEQVSCIPAKTRQITPTGASASSSSSSSSSSPSSSSSRTQPPSTTPSARPRYYPNPKPGGPDTSPNICVQQIDDRKGISSLLADSWVLLLERAQRSNGPRLASISSDTEHRIKQRKIQQHVDTLTSLPFSSARLQIGLK